jgi:hypothetical protein
MTLCILVLIHGFRIKDLVPFIRYLLRHSSSPLGSLAFPYKLPAHCCFEVGNESEVVIILMLTVRLCLKPQNCLDRFFCGPNKIGWRRKQHFWNVMHSALTVDAHEKVQTIQHILVHHSKTQSYNRRKDVIY